MHNIEKIVPVSDARWAIKYKCNNCSCITDKFVGISRDISVQNRSGRGEVNLDFSCKSCKRVNKITITNPHEDAPYDAIKKSDKHPKALLGLSVHGSAEPIEIDLEACGPWEASYKVHGKTVLFFFYPPFSPPLLENRGNLFYSPIKGRRER
uniref:Uncharacterized protein n=1 Tax=Arcella intermedia TaxID=1963864 RepID=A0A6B2LNT7_9EUKA